jgi:hypothetical protein
MKTLFKALSVSLLVMSPLAYADENVVLKLDIFINNALVKPILLKGYMAESFTVQIDSEVKYDIVPTLENGAVKL